MCGGVRGAPLQDRHALHVLLHAIEEVVHVSFVRQTEAPALALQVPQIGLSYEATCETTTRTSRQLCHAKVDSAGVSCSTLPLVRSAHNSCMFVTAEP